MNTILPSPISKWTLAGFAAFAFGLMASLATACEVVDEPTGIRILELDQAVNCSPRPHPEPAGDQENGKIEPIPKELICATPSPPPTELNPDFVTDLLAQLRDSKGNLWVSPYSITEAMAMVHAGAKGNTAGEIAKAMSLPENQAQVAKALQQQRNFLIQALNQGDNRFAVANALCVTGGPPLPGYLELLRKQYEAEVFSGGLKEINAWVKKKTHGEIETILEQLDPNSACVLLNAVYFKGKWQNVFNPKHTHKAPFHVSADKQVEVDMMRQEGRFQIHRGDSPLALSLPYQNGTEMVLIMGNKSGDLSQLEERLDADLLKEILDGLVKKKGSHPTKAKLFLPKFKLETKYNLVPTMQALGIKDAFDMSRADFSAMYSEGVCISRIVHKATLEVDEAGSVAAAVTAVEMRAKGASIDLPLEIRFDRPFLVMIRDATTQCTLFSGRVSDPTAQ